FAAPTGKIAHDFTHAIFRDADFDHVNRLEQARSRGHERFFEGEVAGDLKGDVFRVNRVHFAVVKIHFHVHHTVAGQDAFLGGFEHALLHRGHEYAVHVLARQRLRELQAGIPRLGFDAHPDLGELAGATGLLLMPVLGIALGFDRFTITHTWFG